MVSNQEEKKELALSVVKPPVKAVPHLALPIALVFAFLEVSGNGASIESIPMNFLFLFLLCLFFSPLAKKMRFESFRMFLFFACGLIFLSSTSLGGVVYLYPLQLYCFVGAVISLVEGLMGAISGDREKVSPYALLMRIGFSAFAAAIYCKEFVGLRSLQGIMHSATIVFFAHMYVCVWLRAAFRYDEYLRLTEGNGQR